MRILHCCCCTFILYCLVSLVIQVEMLLVSVESMKSKTQRNSGATIFLFKRLSQKFDSIKEAEISLLVSTSLLVSLFSLFGISFQEFFIISLLKLTSSTFSILLYLVAETDLILFRLDKQVLTTYNTFQSCKAFFKTPTYFKKEPIQGILYFIAFSLGTVFILLHHDDYRIYIDNHSKPYCCK